jgi:antitoxin (DNA-binding transcriptional repressor) of toxin-antitoxin stability system
MAHVHRPMPAARFGYSRVGNLPNARKVVKISGQMKSIAVSRFKAQCLSLLEDVARTGRPLMVLKRGRPLARVIPSGGDPSLHPQRTLRGTVTYLGDIVGPVVARGSWRARLPRGPKRPERR